MKSGLKVAIPLLFILVLLLVFQSLFFIGYVPTASMEPTLKEGSFIVAERKYSELKRGDVIVFRHDGSLMVKRIAAVQGDTVLVRDEPLIVPRNCFYVLGDNESHSVDSRFWEYPFVRENDILAKVFL